MLVSPRKGGQTNAARGKAIADNDLDINYEKRNQTLTSKQSMKKRRTLTQSMQKWSYLKMGHCIRGQ